jgi:prepilin-type N-terminal cleavage/methylation domain-containing protein
LNRRQRGVTLIEASVVLAVTAILAGAAAPNL